MFRSSPRNQKHERQEKNTDKNNGLLIILTEFLKIFIIKALQRFIR